MSASIARETVDFDFESLEDAVTQYAEDFGLFVIARAVLEPQGRWQGFLEAFGDLITRFNRARDGTVRIRSDYFVITIER